MTTDDIPRLKIEANDDGTLTLEQDWCGNVDRVAVHPVHVRHLAERLGMIREMSASDAELLRTERGQVASLRQENDRLKRNMLRLREHALSLQRDFAEHADWAHADLLEPMNQINSVVSLFDMACDDFADAYEAQEPTANPWVSKQEPSGSASARPTATTPKTDGFEAPPKTGAFGDGASVTPGHDTSRPNGPSAKGRGANPAGVQELHPRSTSAGRQLQLEG
ncbi:MAG: hypothetical protein DI587_22255 [Variovorax paradoxus]|nr:MAG: hypothetical protein DI583_22255 [Variovorax paradoxus]PZQ06396.1 MAG: hypothetical protein DI587_22255 [Variovorax paradoxus]